MDRFLVSENFRDNWANFEVICDTRLYSDHRPLVLKQVSRNYGPIPFKFFNMWMEDQEVEKIVINTWRGFDLEGRHNKLFLIMQKLKAVKEKIKEWVILKRKKEEELKSEWLKRIEMIDKLIEEGKANQEHIKDRMETTRKIFQKEKKYKDDVAQRNKNRWCLEGDENSAMFHKIINKKKHIINIKGITIDGVWEVDPYRVKDHFKTHFENLFKEDPDSNWRQDMGETSKISEAESVNLEREFDENELKEALWNCGKNKSPGPDGFTADFFRNFWDVVKKDLLEAFNEFARKPKIPKCVNSAFITLIPKVNNPNGVQDFRPISLISSVYKMLSKMLANRLKKVLPKIIDKNQSAFVKDRQILDGPLVVNEVIDWAKAKKKALLIFKTDIAKAYDTVSWEYLNSMMIQKGFGEKWRKWVFECLKSGSSSVLVNASPTTEFSLSRGLRQGDPMSPFLFTLIMEWLNNAINKAANNGGYRGIEVGSNKILLTHLFFADDAIFFGEWSVENILNLIRILYCFQKTAGLKVNFEKSALIGVGTNQISLDSMAAILGCKVEKLPSIFLGMPIGVNMGSFKPWKQLVERFKKKT